MSQSIKCSNCKREYDIPSATTFYKSCTCGTLIFRNTADGIIFYHAKGSNSNYSQRMGEALQKFLLWSIPVTILIAVIMFAIDKLDLKGSTQTDNNNNNIATVTSAKPVITTYTGNCTQYKLTLVNGNQKKYSPIAKSVAKITIDHNAKKFTFIFNGKVVYSYTRFDSYQDNDRGIEGYSFSGNWSAMRSNANGTFTVYNSYSGSTPELGYEYEMTNYNLN